MRRILRTKSGPSFAVPLDQGNLNFIVGQLNRSPWIGDDLTDEKTSRALGDLITDLLRFEQMTTEKRHYNRLGLFGGEEPSTLLESLGKRLATVKWGPHILGPGPGRKAMYFWESAVSGDWSFYAGHIFVLASYGLLDYLRRCRNCGKWVVASRRDQRFCSGACRVSHFKKTPEGRARNREYMRRYRAQSSKRAEGRRDRTARSKGR